MATVKKTAKRGGVKSAKDIKNTRDTKPPNQLKSKRRLSRWLPLLILALGIVAFFLFGGPSYISLEALSSNRQALEEWVGRYGIWAQLFYILLYILATAFSLPVGAILTITAGFLFGIVVGTIIVVLGATIGSIAIFVAVQMGVGDFLTKNTGSWVARMSEGFNKNAFSYLLMLRLIPIFPFALVNVVPALLGVSLSVYVVATFIGIIPGSLVYVLLGNGLGAIFDAGGNVDMGIIFDAEILLPILALAGLVFLQLIFKKLFKRSPAQRTSARQTSGAPKRQPKRASRRQG